MNLMITLTLLIKKLLGLIQKKLKYFFEMPIEVTDGCLIMGNGVIANNDLNTNALYFFYQQKDLAEIFGEIIEKLDRIEDYEEEIILTGTSADHVVDPFNIIPYGLPSKCHEKLVVIVDGEKDIAFILSQALLHVGKVCRGDTLYILFYITIDEAKWNEIWLLYEPAFMKLKSQNLIDYLIHYKLKKQKSN